jgi:hypothetical protein
MQGLRPVRIRVVAAFAIVALFAVAGLPRALAQPASLGVTWDAPKECPDQAYVRGEVERLLMGGPHNGAPVEARARVARADAGRWSVHLVTVREGATGERSLEASSCRSLADATALIIALTIDPARVAANRPGPDLDASAGPVDSANGGGSQDGATEATPATPESAPPQPLPPTTAASAKAAPKEAPPKKAPDRPGLRSDRFAIVASVGGDLGSLPKPAYGFTLALALLAGGFRFEAYGAYWPAQPSYVAAFPSDGGQVRLITGGLRACYAVVRGVLELGPCAGLELGAMHGEGFGVLSPSASDGLWFAASLTGRAAWRIIGPFGLALDVGAFVPFRRDQFFLTQLGDVHQAALVEGRAVLGPELRF